MNNINLDKAEEVLFQTIHKHKRETITPSDALKSKLDKALAEKRREKSFFTLRIPAYQSVAAAAIFFILGIGTNFLRFSAVSPQVVHVPIEVEVIKYVEKPVVTEVVKYVDRPVVEIRYVKEPDPQQQMIAQHAVFENSFENQGISLHEDTVLKKMLVTVY